MNSFDLVIKSCSDLLDSFPDAKQVAEYLDGRLSKQAQKDFAFGYFPTNANLQTLVSAVGNDILKDLALIYDRAHHNGYELIRERHATLEDHNLVMPYRDAYGNVMGIVGRSILDDGARAGTNIPKYKNTSFDKRQHLFGLFEAKKSIVENKLVFIVEGQFDCISAHDKGMKNVVALGSSSMTVEQCALLLRYTNNFALLLDNDDGGKSGRERIVKNYTQYANISNAKLPDGFKDLDEFLKENSPSDIIID